MDHAALIDRFYAAYAERDAFAAAALYHGDGWHDEVAMGKRPHLQLFGTDYPTPDGTNVRDYIHVEDLADAHILAMEKLKPAESMFLNLGTGRGFSNREIVKAVEKVTGKQVPVKESPRRPGDAIALYADPSKAKQVLGWEAKYKDPETIIRSAWNWFEKHPRGYRSTSR